MQVALTTSIWVKLINMGQSYILIKVSHSQLSGVIGFWAVRNSLVSTIVKLRRLNGPSIYVAGWVFIGDSAANFACGCLKIRYGLKRVEIRGWCRRCLGRISAGGLAGNYIKICISGSLRHEERAILEPLQLSHSYRCWKIGIIPSFTLGFSVIDFSLFVQKWIGQIMHIIQILPSISFMGYEWKIREQ